MRTEDARVTQGRQLLAAMLQAPDAESASFWLARAKAALQQILGMTKTSAPSTRRATRPAPWR